MSALRRQAAEPRVISFDVFDTLLTRRVGDPKAVFPLVAAHLAHVHQLPVTVDGFAAARARVEQHLGSLRQRPPALAEIAQELVTVLGLPRGVASLVAEAELACERELVVALPGATGLVEEARRKGRVIFVADTPLPEAFIRELLERHGLARPSEGVWASADRGATKASGRLYDLVVKDLGLEPAEIEHHGDNQSADVAAARERGWAARPLTAGRLTRYEHALENEARPSGGLTSWLAGSSRLARTAATDRGVAPALSQVAAGVIAPALLGYVLWVGAQAQQRGLGRLYFAGRDGEIMLEVARNALGKLLPDVELRYLHGSRQAWIFPGCAESDSLLRRWVAFRRDFTAEAAVRRVGLSLGEASALTSLPFLDPAQPHRPLGQEERDALQRSLLSEPALGLIRDRARAQLANVRSYLAQEGFADDVPSGLVDAGWAGSTALALDHLLDGSGYARVAHLFVGLSEDAAHTRAAERPPDLSAWLFDRDLKRGVDARLAGANVLFEMFCAGTEGRTLGYERQGDRIQPVLERSKNREALAWGLLDVWQVVRESVALTVPQLKPENMHTDLAHVSAAVLSQFWTDPTPQEVTAWGSFPWEEETWPPYYPVAEPLTTTSVLRTFSRGDVGVRRRNSWRAGTAVASPFPWSALLKLRGWQEKNGARTRRIPRRLRLEWYSRRS